MSLEGQNVIRFVIRFDYTYLGKVGSVASLFQRLRLALGQNKVTICTFLVSSLYDHDNHVMGGSHVIQGHDHVLEGSMTDTFEL